MMARRAPVSLASRLWSHEHDRLVPLGQCQRCDEPCRTRSRNDDGKSVQLGHGAVLSAGGRLCVVDIQLGLEAGLINVSNWPIAEKMDTDRARFDHLGPAAAATARLTHDPRRLVYGLVAVAVLLSWGVLIFMAGAAAQRGLPGELGPGAGILRALPELPASRPAGAVRGPLPVAGAARRDLHPPVRGPSRACGCSWPWP